MLDRGFEKAHAARVMTRSTAVAPLLVWRLVPGLAVASIGSGLGWLSHRTWPSVSAQVVAVTFGVLLANVVPLPDALASGLRFAAKRVLRVGIVLLGFRLSLSQIVDLGLPMLAAVVLVVVITFFGTQRLGRWLGLSPGLSLLVATGYSICGASAIAAAEPFADASEEEVAYAIGLVTICGSLAIGVLPVVASLLGLSSVDFGSWVGASVHDVGQVVATASVRDSAAVTAAVVVKLTRVVMLAPLLAYVALTARRRAASEESPSASAARKRPALLPPFIALFLGAALVRSIGVVSRGVLDGIQEVETFAISMGLVGLGTQVRFSRLRRVGGRPLVLGLASWLLVAAVSLVAITLAT